MGGKHLFMKWYKEFYESGPNNRLIGVSFKFKGENIFNYSHIVSLFRSDCVYAVP